MHEPTNPLKRRKLHNIVGMCFLFPYLGRFRSYGNITKHLSPLSSRIVYASVEHTIISRRDDAHHDWPNKKKQRKAIIRRPFSCDQKRNTNNESAIIRAVALSATIAGGSNAVVCLDNMRQQCFSENSRTVRTQGKLEVDVTYKTQTKQANQGGPRTVALYSRLPSELLLLRLALFYQV